MRRANEILRKASAFFAQAELDRKHKRDYPGMPIRKEGGCWLGDPERLEQFYKDLAAGETERWLGMAEEPGKGKAVKGKA